MKILNFLNVSNPSNLEADSGYIFQKLLMEEIANSVSWDFYFICPENTPLSHKKIKKIEIIEPSNKFKVRFNFEWNKIVDTILDIVNDIDLVLVNQPEQSSNMYALINSISEKYVPIITYFHYLPVIPNNIQYHNFNNTLKETFRFDNTLNRRGLGKVILQRNSEAITVSKCSITCSNFSKKVIEKILLSEINLKHECLVIPPPVTTKLTGDLRKKHIHQSKQKILYNHRLYDEYGTEKIISFLKHFYSKVNKEFVLIVTDPTYGRSSERNRLDDNVTRFRKMLSETPFVEFVHCKTQREYFELIKDCDLGLGPMKPSAAWSMAVMDMMACGKPVLCPNYAAFPEMVSNQELLYSSEEEFSRKLNYFVGKKYENNISEFCRKQAQKFSIENCAEKFIALFKSST